MEVNMKSALVLLFFSLVAFSLLIVGDTKAAVRPISSPRAAEKSVEVAAGKDKKEKLDKAKASAAKIKDADVRKAVEEIIAAMEP
jgi:hypothetical protein